jgi:hypothetical protein
MTVIKPRVHRHGRKRRASRSVHFDAAGGLSVVCPYSISLSHCAIIFVNHLRAFHFRIGMLHKEQRQ